MLSGRYSCMPIKIRKLPSATPPIEEDVEMERKKIEQATADLDEIENTFLPDVIEKEAPVFTKLYNLGEKYIPTSGHFLGLVATVLATMGLDEPRQANLGIGATVGEGKTLILSQFRKLPFVNFFTRTTFSKYVLMKCGYFLLTPGKELPQGVRLVPGVRGKEIDKSGAVDKISYYFDIVTEGEGIFTTNDVPKLLQLWNSLIEQGSYEGGDSFNGWYRIGCDPAPPVKHGLIISATMSDFQKHIVKQIGWGTRMVLATYVCTEKENRWISEGIMRDYLSSRPDISYQIQQLLSHLPIRNVGGPKLHCSPVKVVLTDEVADNLHIIRDILMSIREEVTMKRAGADANRLVKGFALLNGRTYTTIWDVIILKSLLVMSRKVEKSGQLGSIGSRLHFQTSLCMDVFRDVKEAEKFITARFKDWKGQPLYNINDIKQAIYDLGVADGKRGTIA